MYLWKKNLSRLIKKSLPGKFQRKIGSNISDFQIFFWVYSFVVLKTKKGKSNKSKFNFFSSSYLFNFRLCCVPILFEISGLFDLICHHRQVPSKICQPTRSFSIEPNFKLLTIENGSDYKLCSFDCPKNQPTLRKNAT